MWAPHRRRLTLGLVFTITLVAFEALAISTVMPVVADDLGGLGLYGWVFSGFFLGSLLGIVLAGQAADRRGTARPVPRRPRCCSRSACASAGLAPSMGVLVAARILQGVGAGAIPAIAYASVGRAYPAAIRPRVFAVFSTAWVIPGLIGPAASSAIEQAAQLARGVPRAAAARRAGGRHHVPGAHRARCPAVDGDGAARRRAPSGRAVVLTLAVGARPRRDQRPAARGSAVPLFVVAAPIAVWAFIALVPEGTLRLAPGMPAAVMVRGILTFAFFGADAYVSLTFQDVRDQPTWVAGVALTGCTLCWTAGAWVQQRWILTAGPRRVVVTGFAFVAVGIAGMVGAARRPADPGLHRGVVVGRRLRHRPGLLAARRSPSSASPSPARRASRRSSLQLSDVLGIALGAGLGGAFVALGEAQGWATSSALELAFPVTLAVAVLGHRRRPPPPHHLPA